MPAASRLASGILLFIPRAAVAGALLALAAAGQVFALNMTYDVPVKVFSFHLVLLSLFLLAPHARRLAAAVFAVGARSRWAAVTQVILGIVLVGANWQSAATMGRQLTPPHTSAIRGIWKVDHVGVNGAPPSPITDPGIGWSDVIIETSFLVLVEPDAASITGASATTSPNIGSPGRSAAPGEPSRSRSRIRRT